MNQNYRHNLLLSINDDLAAYYSKRGGDVLLLISYPVFYGVPIKTVFTESTQFNDHIKAFASCIFRGSSSTTLLQPDIESYLMSKYAGCHYPV